MRILKYEQIEGFLRQELSSGKFPVDSRFHSENDIAKHFSVTQLTARKAFVTLEKEGFLRRKRGDGTFVARLPETPERLTVIQRCIIGIVTPERNIGANLKQGHLLAAVHQRLEDAGYLTMLTHNHIDSLRESGVGGVVVLGELPPAWERGLLRTGIPAVGFSSDARKTHGVCFDYTHAGAYLVGFLQERGIRHLAMLGEGDDALEVRYNFEKPIAQAASRAGLKLSVAVPPVGSVRDDLQRLLQAADPPDAILAMNSWSLGTIQSVLEQHSLRIGKDISVIAHGLNSLLIPSDPPFSYFDVDDDAVAEVLVSELFALIRDPGHESMPAPIRYSPVVDRGSIVRKSVSADAL